MIELQLHRNESSRQQRLSGGCGCVWCWWLKCVGCVRVGGDGCAGASVGRGWGVGVYV